MHKIFDVYMYIGRGQYSELGGETLGKSYYQKQWHGGGPSNMYLKGESIASRKGGVPGAPLALHGKP